MSTNQPHELQLVHRPCSEQVRATGQLLPCAAGPTSEHALHFDLGSALQQTAILTVKRSRCKHARCRKGEGLDTLLVSQQNLQCCSSVGVPKPEFRSNASCQPMCVVSEVPDSPVIRASRQIVPVSTETHRAHRSLMTMQHLKTSTLAGIPQSHCAVRRGRCEHTAARIGGNTKDGTLVALERVQRLAW